MTAGVKTKIDILLNSNLTKRTPDSPCSNSFGCAFFIAFVYYNGTWDYLYDEWVYLNNTHLWTPGNAPYNYSWIDLKNNGWKKLTVITNATTNAAKMNMLFGLDGNYTGNITIDNVIVSRSVIGQTVYLDTNISGWTTPSGASPLINITLMDTIGTFNITAWSPGNNNYSASSHTWYAKVQ